MTCRELDDLITLAREERVRADEESAGSLLEGRGKRRLDSPVLLRSSCEIRKSAPWRPPSTFQLHSLMWSMIASATMSRSVSVSGRRLLPTLNVSEAHVTAQFLSDGWSPDGHAPLERSGNGN